MSMYCICACFRSNKLNPLKELQEAKRYASKQLGMKVHTVVKHVVTFLSLFSGLRLYLLCLFRIAIRVSTPLLSYNCKLVVVSLTVRQLLLLDRMQPKALKMLNSGM